MRNHRMVWGFLFIICVMCPIADPQSAPPRKDIPAIAKAANGSIVSIVMSDKDGKPVAQGSGFFVSKDGLIVTNYHVIAEGSSAVVKLPDGAFYVVDGVVASDKVRDIAVIKAHGQNFRALALGNSSRVQVGEEVVAIGNPLSLESTVSNGIVSAIREAKEEGGKFLQVTAPISPGSSGGPLFNMVGEVVGITTMYLKGGENLNFAIPVNDAKRLLLTRAASLDNLPNEAAEEDPKGSPIEANSASQQKVCDEKAEKFARYESQVYGKAPSKYGYVAHYDLKTKRCYVETVIDFGDGKNPDSSGIRYSGGHCKISDAFVDGETGRAIYGNFAFNPDGTVMDGIVPGCKVYPQGIVQGGTSIQCRSEEEFNDLVARYFGIVHPPKPTIPNEPLNKTVAIHDDPKEEQQTGWLSAERFDTPTFSARFPRRKQGDPGVNCKTQEYKESKKSYGATSTQCSQRTEGGNVQVLVMYADLPFKLTEEKSAKSADAVFSEMHFNPIDSSITNQSAWITRDQSFTALPPITALESSASGAFNGVPVKICVRWGSQGLRQWLLEVLLADSTRHTKADCDAFFDSIVVK